MKSYRTCQNMNTQGYCHFKSILDNTNLGTLEELKRKFITVEGIRAEIYRMINPQLKVHDVYNKKEYIDGRKRIMFSRFRLSSHRLRIETGDGQEYQEKIDCANVVIFKMRSMFC